MATLNRSTLFQRLEMSLLLLLVLNQLAQQLVRASGVFEINFSSLVDSYGRDLRDDCCSWQNYSSHHQLPQRQPHNHHHHQHQLQLNHQKQHQQPFLQNTNQLCDPSKCQLIIRICVKNYQTQIDPNQCTFGELSAQVVKPNEPAQFAHYPLVSPSTLNGGSLTRNQLVSPNSNKRLSINNSPSINNAAGSTSAATNIHHQRMLFQQQYQTPFQHYQSRYQPQFHHNPTGLLSSGQPRAMRTIAFQQPITFPFNFTWPVSSRDNQSKNISTFGAL